MAQSQTAGLNLATISSAGMNLAESYTFRQSAQSAKVTAYELLVPKNSKEDMLAVETFFSALAGYERGKVVCCELWGTALEMRMVIRAADADVASHVAQLARAAWPQAELVPLDGEKGREDPLVQAQCGIPRAEYTVYEYRMREMPLLPLRTHITREGRSSYDDLSRQGDPMLLLMASLCNLRTDEQTMLQFALRPIEDSWGKLWRGSSQDIHNRLRITPAAVARFVLGGAALAFLFIAVIFWLIMLINPLSSAWQPAIVLSALAGLCVFVALRVPPPPDPDLVAQKIRASAFRAVVRLFIWASPERSAVIEEQVSQSLSAYGFPAGNALVSIQDTRDVDLGVPLIQVPRWHRLFPQWSPLYFGRRQPPILTAAEIAYLWHVPHAHAGFAKLRRTRAKQIATGLPAFVNAQGDGVPVGTLAFSDEPLPVFLPRRALHAHVGLVGATQSGKTNMMALLAHHIMRTERDSAIIVLDPHSTLAQSVLRLVPDNRKDDVIYISLADKDYAFGLNLIDQKGYPDVDMRVFDKHISDIIQSLRRIWEHSWGPRLEDYLRESLEALLISNQMLMREYAWQEYARRWLGAAEPILRSSDLREKKWLTEENRELLNKLLLEGTRLEEPGSVAAKVSYNRLLAAVETWRIQGNQGMYSSETLQKLYEFHSAIRDQVHEHDTLLDKILRTQTFSEDDWDRDPFAFIYHLRLLDRRNDRFVVRKLPLQFTLLDVAAILTNDDFRRMIVEILQSGGYYYKLQWWYENYVQLKSSDFQGLREAIRPVLNKINAFISFDSTRRIFGQSESSLRMRDVLDNHRILVLDLAAGTVGQETVDLVGSMVINHIVALLFSRQASLFESSNPLKRVYLIVDEFQSFSGANYAVLLAELSKFGVTTIMGTQSLQMLKQGRERTEIPWLDNIKTLMVFPVGSESAQQLARELDLGGDGSALQVNLSDIVGLSDYHCLLRARDEQGQTHVLAIKTHAAQNFQTQSTESMRAMRDQSRMLYQTPVALVDQTVRHMLSFHIVSGALQRDDTRKIQSLGRHLIQMARSYSQAADSMLRQKQDAP